MDLQGILQSQRQAFLAEGFASAKVRRDRVDRLILLLLENADALAEAMRQDFGHRSPLLSLATDVLGMLPSLKHTGANIAKWMRPRTVRPGMIGWLGGKAWIQWQPLGVVGIISPWNFPVGLAVQPLAQAFAAGNRAMIKVSETTPRTAALMEELFRKTFDATEAMIVTGGPEIGAQFSALRFDHLFFTGAPSVGRHIQRAAADNLVPVTLELGGKCPVVIAPEADFARAAERVAFGKTLNAGQICLSPDYVFAPRGREREFANAMVAAVTKIFPRLLDNDDYTSVVSPRHHARLQSYVDEARTEGAEIIEINPAQEDFSRQPHQKMPPTLVLGARSDMKILQEEIFGPLLPIIGYDGIDEVIASVNAGEKPLATYYFGSQRAPLDRYLERTFSGGAVINDVILHATVEDLPFGGVGQSGMGTYHGRAGFETFSHARGVARAPVISPNLIMSPPYSRLRKLFGWMIEREKRQVRRRLGRVGRTG